MILHEVYFAGLGDPNEPGAALAEAIDRDFGGLERWRAEFAAMGRAQAGGSGWVILTYSPRDDRLVNAWAADHIQPQPAPPAAGRRRRAQATAAAPPMSPACPLADPAAAQAPFVIRRPTTDGE